MQAYVNVGTVPQRKVAAGTGKAYWEFRAAESLRGDSEVTWYTVRLFREEDPGLAKGEFVCVTGKLRHDVFMSRDGKPMGVLVLLAFSLGRVASRAQPQAKGQAEHAAPAAPATEAAEAAEPDWTALVR